MTTEASIDRAKALLLEAAFDRDLWPAALDATAAACGARSGQLICLDEAGSIVAHWLTNVPEDFTRQVEVFGLSDRAVNPRLRIGMYAPVLQAVADQDHIDRETRARHPIYAEMFDRHDLPFNCQAVLLREPARLVRMSVTRTTSQGPLDADAFRAFAMIAPHVQAAVRFQASLEGTRQASVLATLDAMSTAGFLLDAAGRVVAISAEAERLARNGDIVRVQARTLAAALDEDRTALETSVALALEAGRTGRPAAGGTVHLGARDGRQGMTFEVRPLPLDHVGFGAGPMVLVVAARTSAPADRTQILQRTFRLSAAEVAVALKLADGDPIATIAATRAVSATTIRSQLQTIYLKLGVHRQAELVALVRGLG